MGLGRRERVLQKIMNNVALNYTGHVVNGAPDACYEWLGPDSGSGRGGGYPRMSLDGQTVAVHLVVYTHYHGFIPGKKQIDHICNNRKCVNPEHLQMVSHLKNQRLRAARTKEKTSGQEAQS